MVRAAPYCVAWGTDECWQLGKLGSPHVKRILLGIILIGIVGLVGGLAWAMRYPALDPIQPMDASGTFDSQLVAQGRELAGFGDCSVCHTNPRTGQEFAGGLPLETPFGTLYSTNITSHPTTGIGAWSEQAFSRAMREGVGIDGEYLYPAFPYDHFTKITEEDMHALYAYMMSVEPIEYTPPDNELRFPFNIRLSLAGWNLLFLRQGVFEPDPSQSDEWNRGAYLVEGLGHCGSCHTPRNLMGAEIASRAFGGAIVEGWYAPALNEDSLAAVPWTQVSLVNYLLDGWDKDHGVSAGPMTPVVNHLYDRSEDDGFAIAAYVESLNPIKPSEAVTAEILAFANEREWDPANIPTFADPDLQAGVEAFEDVCANCHKAGGSTVPLGLTSTMRAPDPRNVIHIFFDGVRPPLGARDHSMPSFGASLTDEDFINVLKFVRAQFTNMPAWEHIEELVAEKRATW